MKHTSVFSHFGRSFLRKAGEWTDSTCISYVTDCLFHFSAAAGIIEDGVNGKKQHIRMSDLENFMAESD